MLNLDCKLEVLGKFGFTSITFCIFSTSDNWLRYYSCNIHFPCSICSTEFLYWMFMCLVLVVILFTVAMVLL